MGMEKIVHLIKKLGGKEQEEEYVPKQVIDRRLDSLRRERQMQLNEMEKEQLQKQIAAHRQKRMREDLYGIKAQKKKKAMALKKQVEILKEKNRLLEEKSLLDNQVDEFKRKKQQPLKRESEWLNRGFV